MQAKTSKENRFELIVIGIALLAFVVGLVGHLAGASFANFDTFGYIAAPIPLILAIIAFVAYKIAASAED
ncbi:hypothetical protein [Pseudoalteromonas arctica]|uniref:DUF3098 domain-containing protein n=1 Tax=Pseudoalteromonas arctica TaxID=394751 RepID=A0A7Y0DS88_9GAMM|nr:hypothetical protein [Pseudoalteromonas arctica]NMM40616.1 hypothetical protein [Pseudoalteromonas arctica]